MIKKILSMVLVIGMVMLSVPVDVFAWCAFCDGVGCVECGDYGSEGGSEMTPGPPEGAHEGAPDPEEPPLDGRVDGGVVDAPVDNKEASNAADIKGDVN